MALALRIEDKLYITKFRVDDKSHLKIKDKEKCRQCIGRPCLTCCPVRGYQLQEDGTVAADYEGCLECGTCRVLCPEQNLEWHYPTGGMGVIYRYG